MDKKILFKNNLSRSLLFSSISEKKPPSPFWDAILWMKNAARNKQSKETKTKIVFRAKSQKGLGGYFLDISKTSP